MSPLLISIAAFVAVAALAGTLATIFMRDESENKTEDRLAMLTRGGGTGKAPATEAKNKSVLQQPLDAAPGIVENVLEFLGNSTTIFEQADTSMTPQQFGMFTVILATVGLLAGVISGLNFLFLPICALTGAGLPLFWLTWRRNRRLSKFGSQLPDALDLVSRALRAGHSLASGFNLVASEMADPIGSEFSRVFEEQNLGIPMEEALLNLTRRVPNLDLKFFCTAVILQRTTGGDLSEILDKIGHLIRERFKILGQVQALTGEGRLSGIVLLALPPVLFLAVYRLNPGYMMLLFTDPMGTQMLTGAVIMQILGALVIRKIINIKV
jgi:tight adherence protein B